MIYANVPTRIVSVSNLRLHWAAKAKLALSHRNAAKSALASIAVPPRVPVTVVLTRLGPRKLDGDNLQSGFKAFRDGIADWLGVDDGSPFIDWQYQQRKGPYGVEVEVI